MSENLNNTTIFKVGQGLGDNQGRGFLGLFLSDYSSLQFTVPVEIRVSAPPLGHATNLGFELGLKLRRLVKDTDTGSLTFGQVIDRVLIDTITSAVTGTFFTVTLDDLFQPTGPWYYFTSQRIFLPISVFDREDSPHGVAYPLELVFTVDGGLIVGQYELEFVVTSSQIQCASLILAFELLDAEALVAGEPTTVWYHQL